MRLPWSLSLKYFSLPFSISLPLPSPLSPLSSLLSPLSSLLAPLASFSSDDRYLHGNGCSWDAKTCERAAEAGSIAHLRYLSLSLLLTFFFKCIYIFCRFAHENGCEHATQEQILTANMMVNPGTCSFLLLYLVTRPSLLYFFIPPSPPLSPLPSAILSSTLTNT